MNLIHSKWDNLFLQNRGPSLLWAGCYSGVGVKAFAALTVIHHSSKLHNFGALLPLQSHVPDSMCSLVCAYQPLELLSIQGVVGVISAVAPDVLCHAAVRARNSFVLLVACSDPREMAGFAGWQDQQVQLQLTQV